MKEIIKVTTNEYGNQLVSARDLHKGLEVKTRFSLWVEQNFKNFREEIDYSYVVSTTQQNQHGGIKEIDDYALLIDMAKHIAMSTGTTKGFEIREYFIEVEKKFNNSPQLPTDPMEILRLTFEAQKNTNDRVDSIETDVKDLKERRKLEPGEYNFLSKAISNRINDILEELCLNKKVQAPLRKELNRNVNELAKVRTRTQIKEKDFEKLLDFIERWQPGTLTIDKAKEIQTKLDMEEIG